MLKPRNPEDGIEAPSGANFITFASPGNFAIFICARRGIGYLASYNHSQGLAMKSWGTVTVDDSSGSLLIGRACTSSTHRSCYPDLPDSEALAAMLLPQDTAIPIREEVVAFLRDNGDLIFRDDGGSYKVGISYLNRYPLVDQIKQMVGLS